MNDSELRQFIEALLFTAHDPISIDRIREVAEEVKPAKITETIVSLQREYGGDKRGIRITEIAGGFQMRTAPEVSPWLKKFHQVETREKLSKPALETLAIIAYKQPIIRSEIEAIRGVGADYVLKTLLEKKLVKTMGRKKVMGAPIIYGTGEEFLRHFGLASLAGLPEVGKLEVKDESGKAQEENRRD
jgi:segregation and condensation protein B